MGYKGNHPWALAHPKFLEHFKDWYLSLHPNKKTYDISRFPGPPHLFEYEDILILTKDQAAQFGKKIGDIHQVMRVSPFIPQQEL